MKWKIFLTLCVSGFFVSFPNNIIGCGPDIDAYDYYTSFFNPDISESNTLRPFYYTGYEFLYDKEDAVSTTDILAEEWKAYCGKEVSVKDTKAFVMEYAETDISNLYYFLEKNKPLSIPDSVKQNSMTNYFMQQKDFEALGYIIYAKKLEPFVNNAYDSWEARKTNANIDIDKKIKNGLQLYAASKKDLFKLKYAYQITRLALYADKNADAIKYYDEYVAPIKTESILQPLSSALKAGALYRLGNKKEAAYLFSKAFNDGDAKKVSNYISFNWALDAAIDKKEYLALCKTNNEKANMLGLFAMRSGANETQTIEDIYTLSPTNKNIETLIAREVNKLESSYFTPLLNKQKGGKLFYYTWVDTPLDSVLKAGMEETKMLSTLLLKMSEAKADNAGLYTTTAAYCALMTKNFTKANEYLSTAKKMKLTTKVNDQWMLTNLLLAINESTKMNVQLEAKILPSLKWLQQKANTEKSIITSDWNNVYQWKNFYRNIMTVALAKKYHAQGDVYKEALCVGAADKIYGQENNYNTRDFLHNETDIKDVEKIYDLMTEKTPTEFENYLLKNSALTIAAVTDFAGTAYLRNYDYKNAIMWLQKAGASKRDTIFKSAFIELLDDIEERLPTEKKTTSKLLFAQEMLQTQLLTETDKANEAKHFYKLATGLYNMTYYGHAWELVQYYRSSVEGYSIPKGATEFQKQYYGCFAAHDMYKKAFDASADKNFKAKCLFMMAKCTQKTAAERMSYNDPNYNYEKAEALEKVFMKKFMNNKYFPQLIKEYSTTKFYEEAYNNCSYLRDFEVKKK
jgi:hypothetical protein